MVEEGEQDLPGKDLKSPLCKLCESPAKYTCPGCLLRTCSLSCIQQHKEETACTGQRSKVKYKPMAQMDDLDILNDYRLLEGIGRELEAAARGSPRPRHQTSQLRPGQHRLRRMARRRGVRLDFLPEGFQRRRENTSHWKQDAADGCMIWRVEWRLPLADAVRVDQGVADTEQLGEALGRHLGEQLPVEDPLQVYRAAREGRQLCVFLQAERVQQGNRYIELPLRRSLHDCLQGRLIIEFPVLVVTTQQHAHVYRDDVIEESFFSLCKQQQEEQRRERRSERRRLQSGAAADEDSGPPRKVPRPRLERVAVVPAAAQPAPPLQRTRQPEPAEESEPVEEPAERPEGPQFVGGAPVVVDLEEVAEKAAAGAASFGLFGADDDADLSD